MPESSKNVPARVSLSDGVHRILFDEIIDGTIPAGAPLNIGAIAARLEVSQTPVREALARLHVNGLVRRVAMKGYRVAPLATEQELEDLVEARLALEPTNAYLATARIGPERLQELEQSVAALEAFSHDLPSTRFHEYWAADDRFHTLIASATDNGFLNIAFRALGGHVQRFRLFGPIGISDAPQAAAEHRVILNAISRGDASAARAGMNVHLENVRERARADRESLGN